MPRVLFARDFDFRHNPRAMTAYKAGQEYLVSQACAAEAVAAGAGQVVDKKKTKRGEPDAGRR